MHWFFRRTDATCATGGTVLIVRPVEGPELRLDLANLGWAMFLHIGEAYFASESGWWVLPRGAGFPGVAVALSVQCPMLDVALRGPLRGLIETATLMQVDLAEPPKPLRGHAARSGVALLSGPFVARLRAEEFQRRIASVDDLPQLL